MERNLEGYERKASQEHEPIFFVMIQRNDEKQNEKDLKSVKIEK